MHKTTYYLYISCTIDSCSPKNFLVHFTKIQSYAALGLGIV